MLSWPQSCPALCDPINCSPLGFSVHEILQARIPGWVAMPFFRDLPDWGIEPVCLMSPALAGGFFTIVPPGKPASDGRLANSSLRLLFHIQCLEGDTWHLSPWVSFSKHSLWVSHSFLSAMFFFSSHQVILTSWCGRIHFVDFAFFVLWFTVLVEISWISLFSVWRMPLVSLQVQVVSRTEVVGDDQQGQLLLLLDLDPRLSESLPWGCQQVSYYSYCCSRSKQGARECREPSIKVNALLYLYMKGINTNKLSLLKIVWNIYNIMIKFRMYVEVKVTQSCPTLCDPRNSPGQNTEVGSLSLLQGIFPTQG